MDAGAAVVLGRVCSPPARARSSKSSSSSHGGVGVRTVGALGLKEFMHRTRVLSLYRGILKRARSINDQDVASEARRQFKASRAETDPLKIQMLVADATNHLEAMQGSTREAGSSGGGDSWLDIDDPEDKRGRLQCLVLLLKQRRARTPSTGTSRYPVLCIKHTDPGRAQPVQILGKDLVVWRDKEERWTCFDDRCPHRAAPLTEGRVEDDGSLLCAYHAWRFDADGKCLSIPQSDSGGRDEAQPKACVKVYPTQVAQDVIWVWGDNGPDAALESALTPPPLVPELADKELLESGKIISAGGTHNDLPYGWDTFMENALDGSHVPVSHHGIAGDRYKGVGPLHLELDQTWHVTPAQGFRFKVRDQPPGTDSTCTFVPPTLVINENYDPSAGTIKLYLYATPSRPGWCRILTRTTLEHRYAPRSKEGKELMKENKRLGKKALFTIATFLRFIPAWFEHPLGNLFLYQDLVLLHHQEKILASAGYDSSTYSQAVFVPATSDRAVVALRRWIAKFGSGGPTWGCDPALPPREYNREALFNAYENHTKNCSTCLGALKNVKKALATAKASTVVFFTWAVLRGAHAAAMAAPSSGPVLNVVTAGAMLPALALTLASLGITKAIQKFHDLYYVYMLFTTDTDPGRAHPVQILGKDLVVWRDKEERWTCFDDRCPHRAAPLTEGRVEDDGSLLCAYHAWRFDADGKCLSIPQSDSGGRDEAQPKACAKVYPTQVAQDVIWVWGDNGPDAALESALTSLPLVPELENKELLRSGTVIDGGGNHNDLAYGWDTFMENVVDGSHVPVAHHGTAGDRYRDVRPLHLELDKTWPATPAQGFRFKWFDDPTGTYNECTFVPPTLVINEINDPYSGAIKLYLYATPSRPGWCRTVTRQVYVHRYAPKSKEAKELVKERKRLGKKQSQFATAFKLFRVLPSWLLHPLGNMFLYQDLIFLHHQEKILASGGYDSSTYSQAVYVPTAADRAVMALRQWIAKFGSGGPAWDKGCDPALPPREYNREALFNVYENHVKTCSTCLRALKNVKKALTAAKASVALSFAWTILRGARATANAAPSSGPVLNAVTVRAMLPALALTLASLGITKAIQKFHDLYYVYNFHHQDNP
eukprot:g9372.t1